MELLTPANVAFAAAQVFLSPSVNFTKSDRLRALRNSGMDIAPALSP
jgi:hypothetical protein